MNELTYFDPAVLRSDSVAIYTAAGLSREDADRLKELIDTYICDGE